MEAMGTETGALRRLLEVALALGAERRTEAVLRVILDAARDLADAQYAALGVPDGDGGFSLFLTAGVDAATWEAIGALPRTHGLLGVLLDDPKVIRLADIHDDPPFGGWPPGHPDMRAFLGVPIVAGGEVLAELYLADKRCGCGGFTEADQQLIETLAAHAALAETRSLVGTLRPPDLEAEGLAVALRKRVDLLRRVHHAAIGLTLRGPGRLPDRTLQREVLRVATEALSNALQHAAATRIDVTLDTGGDLLRLTVADDGVGFDLPATARASRRLGLTSMRERAEALGGVLHIDTAPGAGTRVTLEVPAAC